MKTYYEQLAPKVLKYVKSYHTDFTKHDKRELDGYTGEFFHGMRPSGTNIFCVNKFENELSKLQKCETTAFFTCRGLRCIYNGELKAEDMSLELASLLSDTMGNDRFFIGKQGKIRELGKDDFRKQLRNRLIPLQRQLDELCGCVSVWNLSQDIERMERKAAEEVWEMETL